MLRLSAVIAAFAGLFASPALAQSSPSDLTILPNTNVATLMPALSNAGLTPQRITVSGEESIVVRSGDIAILLRPTVCNPNCAGLLMYTLFEGAAAANTINSYNGNTPPTVAFTAQGNTILSRYLIADHGMTQGSFLVNVVVFDNTVAKWLDMSRRAVAQSVSLGPQGEPVKSNFQRETEEYLKEAMSRRELFSGRDTDESY
ncbi:MAG: hypothetical protein AAGH41_00780 [Pseudomonadota bacterium]